MLANWKKTLAPWTVYMRARALHSLLIHLRQYGAPKIQLQRLRQPQPRGVTATQEQIDTLLAAARPAMRLFILLCWQLALRYSEALAVTPRTIDATAGTITIPTKGGKSRRIQITPAIAVLLAAAITTGSDPDEPCVFLLHGKSLSKDAFRKWWNKLVKQAGITGLNPHDLRRTTATALYAESHDLRAVQQYLGHNHMLSTVKYLAPLKDEQLQLYQKLLGFHSEVKQ
jgi:integrase